MIYPSCLKIRELSHVCSITLELVWEKPGARLKIAGDSLTSDRDRKQEIGVEAESESDGTSVSRDNAISQRVQKHFVHSVIRYGTKI